MMNTQQQIEKQINHIELQLKKLSLNASNSDVYEDLQNSLILQKAILKKELENSRKKPIIEKIKNLLPHKEKLICDYFN